ncbi:diacylglycerol kinase [Thioflexithrix psekupsensis]|uniref:Diacylglycerol kinase n=1 Tax=Thioflexithrix psekupsensis TaxID=1570016 RepID=A0A251X5G1_9GAMM|nr:diacylglycerol kinase [Thioflexithrix psekupsensis]OUD12439.1 diacylglycerol kinase [Thioflexithrix psekupsensis]
MQNKFLGTGQAGFHPLRKIKVIISGLYFAVITDFSVAYKLVLSILFLIAAFYLRRWVDFEILLLATALVLMAEMFNTTVEALCDFVETQHNEKIRIIKDIAAAATGVAILVWFVVLSIELLRLWRFFIDS